MCGSNALTYQELWDEGIRLRDKLSTLEDKCERYGAALKDQRLAWAILQGLAKRDDDIDLIDICQTFIDKAVEALTDPNEAE